MSKKRYMIKIKDDAVENYSPKNYSPIRSGQVIELEELPEVKEESLEEKYQSRMCRGHMTSIELADIARQHYKGYVKHSEVMRVFKDEVSRIRGDQNIYGRNIIMERLDKALESLKEV